MKGQLCLYKPGGVLICQEGYCQDCQIYLDYRAGDKARKVKLEDKTISSFSSSIYPIDSLRKQIRAKRDEAFAEAVSGSREKKLQLLAMVNAYDVCLKLIRGII